MSRVKWKTIANVPGLLKDEVSGRYYARFWRDSKPVWISLKTDVPTVAKARIAKEQKAFESSKKAEATVESGEATVEQISQVYLSEIKNKVDIKSGTRFYYGQIVKAILESWPELKATKPKDISESDCQAWAKTVFRAHYSANRYNVAVDRLRDIFQAAIERGIIYRNPAAELGKRTPKRKRLDLPSASEFAAIIESVRKAGELFSNQCADLIEFLAYSGCRIDEARNVKWEHIAEDGIWVHGGSEGTKSGESRFLPFNPALKRLLDDLREYRAITKATGVTTCWLSGSARINRACTETGVARLTHHALRHLFATRAIEASIDVPTVANWLGHKDGGALLMRTHSHLVKEHSQAMAAKLTFLDSSCEAP